MQDKYYEQAVTCVKDIVLPAQIKLRSWKLYCVEQNIAGFRSRSINGPDFRLASMTNRDLWVRV